MRGFKAKHRYGCDSEWSGASWSTLDNHADVNTLMRGHLKHLAPFDDHPGMQRAFHSGRLRSLWASKRWPVIP